MSESGKTTRMYFSFVLFWILKDIEKTKRTRLIDALLDLRNGQIREDCGCIFLDLAELTTQYSPELSLLCANISSV